MKQMEDVIILKLNNNNINCYNNEKFKKIPLYVLICICGMGCQLANKFNDSKNNLSSIPQKIINITCDSCVLSIKPTLEQIEQIKSNYQNEEDFYVMADDANFYTVNAIEYLKNKNVNVFYLDSIKRVCFNEKDTLDFCNLAWDFVLYKKNKTPKIVKAIDLKNEFKNYFNISNNEQKETNSLDYSTDDIKSPTYVLVDLQNKETLKNMGWMDIADLLFQNPITQKNVVDYNDAAYYLIEFQKYNEARLILLEVTKKFQNRVVAWLNLGDAQWGFDDTEEAKESYKKYVELMKSQGKDMSKIPQRVYDRIKIED